ASLHARPPAIAAAAERRGRCRGAPAAASGNSRDRALASGAAGRLSVRAALSLCARCLPARRLAAATFFGRARRGVRQGWRFALGRAMTALFRMRDVVKHYRTARGMVHAVDGVSLDIAAGEVLGLVGESGCGKSSLARLATRIAVPDSGTIEFDGADITALG